MLIRRTLSAQLFAFDFEVDSLRNWSLQSALRPFDFKFPLANGHGYTLRNHDHFFSYTRHKVISDFQFPISDLLSIAMPSIGNRQSEIGNVNKSGPTTRRQYFHGAPFCHSSNLSTSTRYLCRSRRAPSGSHRTRRKRDVRESKRVAGALSKRCLARRNEERFARCASGLRL